MDALKNLALTFVLTFGAMPAIALNQPDWVIVDHNTRTVASVDLNDVRTDVHTFMFKARLDVTSSHVYRSEYVIQTNCQANTFEATLTAVTVYGQLLDISDIDGPSHHSISPDTMWQRLGGLFCQ